MKPHVVAPAELEPDAEARSRAPYDLAFIGAGASTSYVLLSLLRNLPAAPARPHRIAVIERATDPFTGLPYGSRATRTSLLITALRDFLPPEERAHFSQWLSRCKHTAFEEFRRCGGPRSAQWWSRHEAAIARDDFDDLYLPRYIFGRYLAERVCAAVERARAAQVVDVEVLHDEVRSVARAAPGYSLRCTGAEIHARRLVLAAGSAPPSPRLGSPADGLPVLIDNPFDHLERTLEQVRDTLRRVPADRTPAALIVGANASAMDLLYQVSDSTDPAVERCSFTVLSPRGELPESTTARGAGSPFVTRHLRTLEGSVDKVTARRVYVAAVADIACGRNSGKSAVETLLPVSEAVSRLLRRLEPDQAAEFAGRWGNQLGRHQRRAGAEYREAADMLLAEGRLRLVAGSYVGVRAEGDGVVVSYDSDGAVRDLGGPVDVIVNCGGSPADLHGAAGFLPARLLEAGLCAPTPFGNGIAVDSSLLAAPDLWVMGPLLAGNVVSDAPIWHMEHCGRITAYGASLGASIARAMASGIDDSNYITPGVSQP